jgi:hypothetical protein
MIDETSIIAFAIGLGVGCLLTCCIYKCCCL